jgi:hypothetical protein
MRTHPWPASSQANPGFVTLIQCGDQGMAVVVRCDKSADTGGVFRASPLVAIRIGGLPPDLNTHSFDLGADEINGHNVPRSSGTSPNFLIALASLKSTVAGSQFG